MAGPFGMTFAPTDDALTEAQAAPGAGAGRRQQAAVKVLSLLPPAVYSPKAFAPNALLQAPKAGMGADPNKAVLASIIRTLLGPDAGLPQSLPTELQSAGSVRGSIQAPHVREDESVARLPDDGSEPVISTSPDVDMTGTDDAAGPFGRTEIFDRTRPAPDGARDMEEWRSRKGRPHTMGVYQ